jgi:3-oxoacyl-[acyl-carrier-protein] synthase II
MSTETKRVVITGAGIFSPIGIGLDAFWKGIAEQKSGLSRCERLEYIAVPGQVVGEVKEFDEKSVKKDYLSAQRKSIKVMCREIELGVASAHLALNESTLDLSSIDHERLGVEFGANQMFSPPPVLSPGALACADENHDFQFERWGEEGLAQMEPLWLLKYLPNMPACHIGIHADARGPNNSLTMAEASGNNVIGEAFRIISRGRADVMLCGSTGTRIHAVKAMHAALWDHLADYGNEADPATWSRPFDASRRGQVIGEGACTFILETEDHAKARGAEILGTILGVGSTCVIGRDGRPNLRQALVNAMTVALRDAGLSPADVGHIHAHGLGEIDTDIQEAGAIADVFKAASTTIPVTSLKGQIGNSGAACGTLELAASLLGLKHGVVPAVQNHSTTDERCPLNVVHGEHAPISNKVVLNVNVTSQGQAAAVVVCGV